MKYLIASDVHGSAFYCEKLIEAFLRESADRLILLGDILYHGPRNDLPGEYDAKAVAAMLNEVKHSILCVKGNCDSEVDQMMLEFPIMAEYFLQNYWEVVEMYEDEYNIEIAKRVRYEEGKTEGIEIGKLKMVGDMLKVGTPMKYIELATGWTKDQILEAASEPLN